MFKDLSMESRNTQTQKCAPIQCTIGARNVEEKVPKILNYCFPKKAEKIPGYVISNFLFHCSDSNGCKKID